MDLAIAAVASGLREGGLLLIRDYALGDGAQLRLQNAPVRHPNPGRYSFVWRAHFVRWAFAETSTTLAKMPCVSSYVRLG